MRNTLFLILLFPSFLLAEYKLSIGAIFRDEAPYLKEWIEFHKIQGVEHFFLYNNLSEDDFKSVLEPYMAKEEITLIEWPFTFPPGSVEEWYAIQSAAYMDCIQSCNSEWVAFLDIDEFLFCSDGKSLIQFLEEYIDFGGLVVNSVYFGTSGIEDIPPDFLMIELLKKAGSLDHKSLLSVKSIVQPKYVLNCKTPHTFIYKEGMFAVNSQYDPVLGKEANSIILDKIRLNHYWTRTEKHFRERKLPLRKLFKNESEQFLKKWSDQYTVREDTTIFQFILSLREKLFPHLAK